MNATPSMHHLLSYRKVLPLWPDTLAEINILGMIWRYRSWNWSTCIPWATTWTLTVKPGNISGSTSSEICSPWASLLMMRRNRNGNKEIRLPQQPHLTNPGQREFTLVSLIKCLWFLNKSSWVFTNIFNVINTLSAEYLHNKCASVWLMYVPYNQCIVCINNGVGVIIYLDTGLDPTLIQDHLLFEYWHQTIANILIIIYHHKKTTLFQDQTKSTKFSFRGRGESQCNFIFDSIHVEYFNPLFFFKYIFFFYHFRDKLSIWKMLMYTLLRGEGSEKMHLLYTQLNVNNYGWP